MSSDCWTEKMPPIKIAPSMIDSDFAHLADQVAVLEEAGTDVLHVDVADGHFVPNLMVGPRFVEVLRGITKLPIDVHLMITDPARYAPAFIKAGAEIVFFHVEAVDSPVEVIECIKKEGAKAGVALKPDTPAQSVSGCIGELDVLMAMTVVPGFSGQSFMESGCRKIPDLRRMARSGIDVYVDGGINLDTAPIAVKYGANVLAAASAVFGKGKDPAESIKLLRETAENALK